MPHDQTISEEMSALNHASVDNIGEAWRSLDNNGEPALQQDSTVSADPFKLATSTSDEWERIRQEGGVNKLRELLDLYPWSKYVALGTLVLLLVGGLILASVSLSASSPAPQQALHAVPLVGISPAGVVTGTQQAVIKPLHPESAVAAYKVQANSAGEMNEKEKELAAAALAAQRAAAAKEAAQKKAAALVVKQAVDKAVRKQELAEAMTPLPTVSPLFSSAASCLVSWLRSHRGGAACVGDGFCFVRRRPRVSFSFRLGLFESLPPTPATFISPTLIVTAVARVCPQDDAQVRAAIGVLQQKEAQLQFSKQRVEVAEQVRARPSVARVRPKSCCCCRRGKVGWEC